LLLIISVKKALCINMEAKEEREKEPTGGYSVAWTTVVGIVHGRIDRLRLLISFSVAC
jgi:hypothetical protein